jgi:hypothetical protein
MQTNSPWLAVAIRWIIDAAIDFAATGIEFYGWVFRNSTGIGVRYDD